ncbi:hypothetical protein CBS101457_003048 [Exobasidium rhododendri]|nr:hypothetical protein CBS101457_003048 [Exobasidium rhododendri]
MASALVPFDSHRWKSRNTDSANRCDATSAKLIIESGPKTDWWRTAIGSEPESAANRSSGPFTYVEVPSDKEHWKAGAWISGSFDERFKQATLFIGRQGYADQGIWVKAGIEVEDGQHNVGCVVAAPYSDWSISPLTQSIGSKPGESKLYIQFTRAKADLFVHYAVADAASQGPPMHLQLLREIKGFAVLPSPSTSSSEEDSDAWHVGVMVCGPLSEATVGQWEYFSVDFS